MTEATAPPSPPASRPKISLLKVLSVAALGGVSVLVIAVSFLPVWNRGHDFSETYAISRMRSYVVNQYIHANADRGTKGYADDLGTLAKEALIDPDFAAARGPQGKPVRGYLFQEVKTLGGKPVDWKKDFALSATPAQYGGAKLRTFVVSTDGVIYSQDFGKSEFIENFPSDPEKAGWVAVE